MRERQPRARPADIVAATGGDRTANIERVKPKPRRSHARIVLLIVLILLVLIGASGYGLVQGMQGAESGNPAPVQFVVQRGDTTSSVASRLEQLGVIHGLLFFSASDLFSLAGRMGGLASQLQPGTYTLRRNMSMNQIVSTLKGLPELTTFTVVPGERAEQVAETLSADGFKAGQFLHAVRHHHFPLDMRMTVGWPHKHTLEGFLYPDTYTVEPGSTGQYLADVMARRFAQLFTPAMRRAAHRQGHSIYQIVIMASIIQREDFLPSQKRLISSVYWNRLGTLGVDAGLGGLLQSDPTVSYALGHRGDWWPNIPEDRSTVVSPFNTYLHPGLPPAPIAEPDIGSLRAALHPAKTTYLYFATKPGDKSGRLYFASTYSQFQCILDGCS